MAGVHLPELLFVVFWLILIVLAVRFVAGAVLKGIQRAVREGVREGMKEAQQGDGPR